MKLRSFLLAMVLCALCVTQASALEYDFDASEDYLFGQPTSGNTIYEWENPNVDRSKNAALVASGFKTPTSYLPSSGEYLIPNLVPGALSGVFVNQTGSSVIPGQYPLGERKCRHDPDSRWQPHRHRPGQRHRRLHQGDKRPLLLRRQFGDAEDPSHQPECQGLPRYGQRRAEEERGTFHQHQYLGWQRSPGRRAPR